MCSSPRPSRESVHTSSTRSPTAPQLEDLQACATRWAPPRHYATAMTRATAQSFQKCRASPRSRALCTLRAYPAARARYLHVDGSDAHEQSRRNARPGCAVHGPRPTVETRRRFLAAAAAAASKDEVESTHDGRPPDPAVRTHPMKAETEHRELPTLVAPRPPCRGPHSVIGTEKGLS